MTILNSMWHILNGTPAKRAEQTILAIAGWSIGSCLVAEMLGYWLHRLLHSGWISFLSRNHMKHHMLLYAPLQKQRTSEYRDATEETVSLGNIGMEWLAPTGLVMVIALILFRCFRVQLVYQLLSLGTTLAWSFVMFSYLHDRMHMEGIWLERNKWLRRWFVATRRLHDIHHHLISSQGLMNRNFGIGFFLFDRLFGTFASEGARFNHSGYEAARQRWTHLSLRG